MKTITEFHAHTLAAAVTQLASWTTENKTPEEIQALATEQFKLEGDKLKYFLAAIESIKDRSTDLKRVVVSQLAEGEAAPKGAKAVEGMAYLAEYFPSAARKNTPKGNDRDGKFGSGKKGGKGDRDGKRGGRDGKRSESRDDKRSDSPRGERPAFAPRAPRERLPTSTTNASGVREFHFKANATEGKEVTDASVTISVKPGERAPRENRPRKPFVPKTAIDPNAPRVSALTRLKLKAPGEATAAPTETAAAAAPETTETASS